MLQISYAPLWETLAARDMKKVDLTAVISSAALKKDAEPRAGQLERVDENKRSSGCPDRENH